MELLSHTQHSMTFHFILSPHAPLVCCTLYITWLLSLPSMDTAQTPYLIPSLLFPRFPVLQPSDQCSSCKIWYSSCRRHDDWCLSCLVELQPGLVDTVYDAMLWRDWFTYCTTIIPDAQILLSDDMCLTFSSSPFLTLRPPSRHTSEFLLS
jgi:hypothetical protein